MYGIDISHWQGEVDFDKVLANNPKIEFIILKVSQAQGRDKKFDTYYSQIGDRAGVGGYIYNKVRTNEQAEAEANFAVKTLKGRKLTCGIWLDMEDASMRGLGKKRLTEIIEIEAAILEKAGYKVGIYCNKDWYLNVLDGKKLAEKYPFWIARYPATDNGTMKDNLSPKHYLGCVVWQYSSKGKVLGINGNVDMDFAYKDIVNSTSAPVPAETPKEDKRIKNMTPDSNPFIEPKGDVKLGSTGEDALWVNWWLWRFGLIQREAVKPSIDINLFKAIGIAQSRLGLDSTGIVNDKTKTTFKATLGIK